MRFVKATYHLETKTVEYEAGDGTRLLKTAGTLNWRFNNPEILWHCLMQVSKRADWCRDCV
jgi:hypothetical protein